MLTWNIYFLHYYSFYPLRRIDVTISEKYLSFLWGLGLSLITELLLFVEVPYEPHHVWSLHCLMVIPRKCSLGFSLP